MTETSSGKTHTYKYDLAGNRVYCLYGSWTYPLASVYDQQNRLTSLTHDTRVTTYGYDLDGNVTTRTHVGNVVVTTTYDALNRISQLQGVTSGSALLYKYLTLWDAAGNLKRSTETYSKSSHNREMTLAYDNANRLTQEAITGSGSGTNNYTYDNAHNMTSFQKSGTTSTLSINSLNQVTSLAVGGRTVTYTYDDNGNRLTKYDPRLSLSSPRTTTYGYGYENRLVSLQRVKSSESALNEFAYDYRTRRVERKRTGNVDPGDSGWAAGTEKVVLSGGQSVREYSGTSVLVDYVRGSDWGGGVGGILYTMRGSTPLPYYTHYNTRGDVTLKSDTGQSVVYTANYTAEGERVKETGSTQDRQKSNTKDEDVFGYANEGFRFRDVETGMFISRDPAGFIDGPNLYTYVRQNPWTHFDPEGLYISHRLRDVPKRNSTADVKTLAKWDREETEKDKKFWDNYKQSYSRMMKTTEGRKLIYAMENSTTEFEIGPTIVAPAGRDTGPGRPGYTWIPKLVNKNGGAPSPSAEENHLKVQISLDENEWASNVLSNGNVRWTDLAHEASHAVEFDSGIVGNTFDAKRMVKDPLKIGTSFETDGYKAGEKRGTRTANIVAQEWNLAEPTEVKTKIQNTYGDMRTADGVFVDHPLGTRTDLQR